MSKCISVHGEYSEHTFTHNPECDHCGEPLPNPHEVMRTALEQIKEMHGPQLVEDFFNALDGSSANKWRRVCAICDTDDYPCDTRKLAEQGLAGGDRAQ